MGDRSDDVPDAADGADFVDNECAYGHDEPVGQLGHHVRAFDAAVVVDPVLLASHARMATGAQEAVVTVLANHNLRQQSSPAYTRKYRGARP